jgi:hypothetical protein
VTSGRAPRAGSFSFDFEEQELDEAAVRARVWAEMERYQGRSKVGIKS